MINERPVYEDLRSDAFGGAAGRVANPFFRKQS